MKRVRAVVAVLAAILLAFLSIEFGLRAGALAWRTAYRAASRPSTFPLYVIGESTSYGEPFAPKISFAKLLALMFGGKIDGKPLEILNLAQPGSSTEAQYWLLLRELALRPRPQGVVLIYAGINESGPEAPPSRLELLADRSLLLSRASWLLRGRRGVRGLDYERRLERLVALARGRGYPVILSTLVGNVRDFQPDDPGLLHRRARLLLGRGEYEQARELFQKAVDQGGTKRPTTAQDQAIRRVARRGGVVLADSRAAFEAAAPQGLPGDDLFMDAHHPNLRGTLLLAGTFARELSRVTGAPVVRGGLTESEARRETGFSRRDQEGVYAACFRWYCVEAYLRAERSAPLARARRYLRLAEGSAGLPMPAYRFLLSLIARDREGVRAAVAQRDAIRRDWDRLGSIGGNPQWTAQLVRDARLPGLLESEARQITDLAAAAWRTRPPRR